MASLKQILSDSWSYRGEGNANLVISLPKTRQILRIPKTSPNNTGQIIEDMSLNFHNLLMVKLLPLYTHPAIQIRTEDKDIAMLNQTLLPFRPDTRKHKNLKPGSATIWSDFSFLPESMDKDLVEDVRLKNVTYCIEIKPKQGYWQDNKRPRECDSTNTEGGNNLCPFCKHQYFKLKKGQISRRSSYCPMDLFSGESQRMKFALKALIDNPQNNFKLFANGTYIYGEDKLSEGIFEDFVNDCFSANGLSSFCEFMERALSRNFFTFISDDVKVAASCEKRHHAVNYCGILEEGCVLEQILRMQMLDTKGTSAWYEEYKSTLCSWSDWKYLQVLNSWEEFKNVNCAWCFAEYPADAGIDDGKNLSVLPYVVSSIAQDCSVMISFRKVRKRDCVKTVRRSFIIDVGVESFLVHVGIIDLYPKAANVIAKHMEREQNSLKAYKDASQLFEVDLQI